MAFFESDSNSALREKIRHVWHALTDEEIAYHGTMRDMFFMAIRKKYGLTRAEAEDILRNISHSLRYEDAA